MNALQLATAKAHLDELKYGMKNEDVKKLDLRSFCVHTERMRKRVRISLYKLAPEWLKYVEEHIVPTIENEDDVIEKMKISTDTRFSSFVQEISLMKSIDSDTNPLLSKIEHSIMTGDCQTESIFDRAALIYRYYEQLKTTGMKDEDIVDADLTGMLGDYLVPFADRYKLRSDSCLYVLHVVKKYYRKDIKECRNFVYQIYKVLKSKYEDKKLIEIPVHLYKTLIRLNGNPRPDTELETFWYLVDSRIRNLENPIDWEIELSKHRRELVIQIVNECKRRMKKEEEKLKHPFSMNTQTLTCFAYTIVTEFEHEFNSKILKDEDYLLNALKRTNWSEITEIVKILNSESM